MAPEAMEKILRHSDLIYFDLKHIIRQCMKSADKVMI